MPQGTANRRLGVAGFPGAPWRSAGGVSPCRHADILLGAASVVVLNLPVEIDVRFFLIDKITLWEVGVRARAVKNVALSEDFFDDHFPRRPVMPGVLMIEGMAQLAGLLLEASLKQQAGKNGKAILSVLERTRFRRTIHPGDTLAYEAQVVSVNETGGKAKVRALLGDEEAVESAMVFAFMYVDDPRLDQKRRELLDLWLRREQA
jgi:3-hydroxyacyl-[acyl-carrier-protein] dehydratase